MTLRPVDPQGGRNQLDRRTSKHMCMLEVLAGAR
jgi:hypothetical protein